MALTKHCPCKDQNRCACEWWGERMFAGRRARVALSKFAGRQITSKADAQAQYAKFEAAVMDGSFFGTGAGPTGGLVKDLTNDQITALYFERVLGMTAKAASTLLGTFGELLDMFMVRHKITPERTKTRHNQLEYARAYFGKDRPLTEFTTLAIEAYGDYLRTARLSKQGRAIQCDDEGVLRHLCGLSAVWTWASGRDLVPSNPFLGRNGQRVIKSGERNPPRETILTWADELRVIALLRDDCRASRRVLLREAMIATVDTGLRQNELEDLRIADLDALPGELRVRPETNKRRKGRSVPILTQRLRVILTRRRLTITGERKPATGFVFDTDGLGLCKADLGDPWRLVREQLTLGDVRWHDLRGTFMSRLLSIGEAAARVASYAGHGTLRMVDVYNRQTGITAQDIKVFRKLFASKLPREADALRRRPAA